MLKRSKTAAFVALTVTLLAGQALAQVSLHDPRGDGHGAGCVVYPVTSSMPGGIFDIVGFKLTVTHNRAIIEIRLAAAVPMRPAGIFQNRHNRTFIPMIDVYVARGGSGYKALLPGRGAVAAMPWQRAIVITGLPETVAAHIKASAGRMAHSVCVPRDVSVRGAVIRAVMPKYCVGNSPEKYSYLVGVLALRSMMGLRHKLTNKPDMFNDPLVVPMAPKPGRCNSWSEEDCAFGTCTSPGLTPRYLDIIAPSGVQKQVLRPLKGVCMLPFMAGHGKMQPLPASAAKQGIPIKDMKNGIITLLLPSKFDKPKVTVGRIAGLYDQNGRLLTPVVVTQVVGAVVILKPVTRVRPQKGLEVRF